MPNPDRHTHRGSAYVLVLACASIIAVVGVAGVLAARALRASLVAHTSAAGSRVAAQSALETTLVGAVNTTAWRTSAAGGAYAANPTGMPRLSVTATDPVDSILDNALGDPVVLTSTANATTALQRATLRLSPVSARATCTQYSICAQGDITFDGTQILTRSGIHSNGKISAIGGAVVGANVSAVGTILGLTFQGTLAPLSPAVSIPGDSAIAPYTAIGTKIMYSAISGASIDKQLISPVTNPYGATTNADGIYVIDCTNRPLEIKNSRILGTLVIINCTLLTLDKSICWEPARQDLPALVATCSIELKVDAASFTESSVSRNMNPPDAPYRGLTNATQTETIASVLSGLYFTTGNVLFSSGKPTFEGRLIAGGTVTIKSSTVRIRENIAELQIPGFQQFGAFSIAPATLRRAVD